MNNKEEKDSKYLLLQMLQKLAIVLEFVHKVNTSENLLNETDQIIYSLY